MKLGIFILHYNTPELTESLHKMVPEAIVIDNGSDPGKKPIVFSSDKRYSDCDVHLLDKNYGFTAGWNKAVEHFYNEFDAFWLMNSDIIVSRHCIKRISELMERHEINIITPAFNCWMNTTRNRNAHGTREVKVIEFTAPVIKKQVFEKVGFFDERFARGWGVEFDFCHRARKAGFKIHVDDGSNFFHMGQQTINATVGYAEYGPKAHHEMESGMSAKYGLNWKKSLYGDKDYIQNLK